MLVIWIDRGRFRKELGFCQHIVIRLIMCTSPAMYIHEFCHFGTRDVVHYRLSTKGPATGQRSYRQGWLVFSLLEVQ